MTEMTEYRINEWQFDKNLSSIDNAGLKLLLSVQQAKIQLKGLPLKDNSMKS